MKKQISIAILALLFATGQLMAQTAKHVIFVTIDGFRPDFYLEDGWKTPNLRAMMKDGAYAKGVNSVFPSMTYPSHTTIVTGVQPVKHGVHYNNMFTPNGAPQQPYWMDSSIHVPTIWKAAKAKGMTVASLYWPVSANSPLDYNIPDIGGLGDGVREEYSLPKGFYAEVKKEVFGGVDKIDHGKNQNIAKIAAYIIKRSKPELMTIHVFSVDGAAHSVGRNGERVQEAVADADEAVGIVINALKEAGIYDSTVLMIGGDHGFYDVKKSISPNVWLKEVGLITDLKTGDWKAQFNTVGGSAYLYLKDPTDKATVDKVKALLAAQSDSVKQYFRLISKEQMTKGGYNPNVAFALTAEHDASFGNASTGAALKPGKGGSHGHFPDTKNIRTGLVLSGPGIRKGAVIDEMDLRDMTPIIVKLLGIPFGTVDGKIPAGLLR
ncbi:alkaline phosphatase family protein [Mucilaginibacter myungsuensis]|uniref:Alkaline phosphatase family protein n=1 Tax=Mucilaginibacter myungsuensis TaxID=649104 RepID=A0A929KZL4_9SPHI|nr:ectonucleotide pyrophosphatase/phosphodiesterase [Mucilaginibacter myungsuensis]MBE9663527.1 alkaline phosphatase family protein [Mucilaginibacter myungsuensis]MDN3600265.1 ectonucleotide pyrophosphatase/phosphodiesterase [Mucilaginibacter myungsuensis]